MGELVRLEGGMWTTRQLREAEQQTTERAQTRSGERAAPVSETALGQAIEGVQEQIGGRLSDEQRQALDRVTGRGGVSLLEGQAGTGKGVVITTAARAWQAEGYRVTGTAVAGATAERLGAEASLDRSMTVDSLIARHEHGTLGLDERSVVVMDEAGMADTNRLSKLVQITQQQRSKLLLVGDGKQLSPVGAGGVFDQIKDRVPSAQLSEIRRARQEWERHAWQQVRDGKAQQALAAYRAHDRLHICDTRQDAAQRMVAAWNRDRSEVGVQQVVMITDASNHELDQINALAQQARKQNGELGKERVSLKRRPYQLAPGDRVIFTKSHRQRGQRRVENGTTGTISQADEKNGRLTIQTSGPNTRE